MARDLTISQSTLSHRISQLEEELGGIQLIFRTTKSFELTEQGVIFLGYSQQILELYDQCLEEMYNIGKNIKEIITITTSKFPGSQILPKFIAEFKTQFPRINFNTLINNSQKSISLLKNDMSDFAGVGSLMHEDKKQFEYFVLGEDVMYFICAPNHDLIKNDNEFVKFEDLKEYPFISREEGSGTRNVFEKQFPRYIELNYELEMNDNDSIISAVSESDYISVLSNKIAKKAKNAGLIKTLQLKNYPIIAKRDIYFLKMKNKTLSKLKEKFWNYLKKNV
ncbi:MAG: HTH-type transcriptional regulator CysL [Promethearchaeota archaeon]|nr:MAG: HTH-type transcriptional regulator CysL [Candidatus Lokiarchaeota archaeon]